jgi:hypothetical protein
MLIMNQKWRLCALILFFENGNNPHFSFFFKSMFCSDNEDPLVRGLALRSLCSLRLESILEYVEKPLRKGLDDISAYVRKTAVLGVLKVIAICRVTNCCK